MNDQFGPVNRYAEALLQAATERGIVQRILEDALLISTCLRAVPELHKRLCMPSRSNSNKITLLRNAFGNHLHDLSTRLMEIMVQRGRTEELSRLDEAVKREMSRREKKVVVEVMTARPIDDRQKTLFEQKIRAEFGSFSTITYTCHPGLIGGYRIRSPERRIDCSIRTGLTGLRKQLLQQ